MRKFVRELCKIYANDENALHGFHKFYDLRRDPGWTEFVKLLHLTRGLMAQRLLSDKFAELSADDKDVLQRTFASLRYFLDFLEKPLPELQRAMFLAGQDRAVNKALQRQDKQSVPARKG